MDEAPSSCHEAHVGAGICLRIVVACCGADLSRYPRYASVVAVQWDIDDRRVRKCGGDIDGLHMEHPQQSAWAAVLLAVHSPTGDTVGTGHLSCKGGAIDARGAFGLFFACAV